MGRYWRRLVSIISNNFGLKLFSFAFALGIWLYLNAGQGQKAAEKAVEVPVELRNIPSDVMVVNPGPGQVEIRARDWPSRRASMALAAFSER